MWQHPLRCGSTQKGNRIMKANRPILGTLLLTAVLAFTTFAAPRDLLPPWPEETLGIWGFNHWAVPMLPGRAVVGMEGAQVAESWSGYSLVRDALITGPVAIPVFDPNAKRPNFSARQGMIRFWFRPDWASAGASSRGPGIHARLLELVGLAGKESETQWALYLNPEGNTVYLSGRGVSGPMDYLKASVNWKAGYWHLIALAYDEQQTTLYVDAVPVATGPALLDVATWQRDTLALVIGSDLTGENPAGGEFDELCTFQEPQEPGSLAFYFRGMWRVAMLGAVESEEREQAKAQWVQRALVKLGWVPKVSEETEQLALRMARPESYPSNALWLNIESVSNGVVTVAIEGTQPDTLYELLSKEDLATNTLWQSEGLWVGAADTNWTLATIAVGTRTNQLFLWAKSWVDEDGNGIPDWWEQETFGTNNVDGYADPDGDGWENLQEYQNGTSPTEFNEPAAPGDFEANLNTAGTAVGLTWMGGNGPVQDYRIERSDPVLDGDGNVLSWGAFNQIAQVNTTDRSYTDTGAFVARNYSSDYFHGENRGSVYRIRATYANGNSPPAQTTINAPIARLKVDGKLIRNAAGRWVAAVSPPGEDITTVRFHWNQNGTPTVADVVPTNFWNGLYVLPYAMVTNQLGLDLFIQGLGSNNLEGAIVRLGRVGGDAPYFVDGRAHLLESLKVLLKAASHYQPYNEYEQWGGIFLWWSHYVLAGTTDWLGASYLFPDIGYDEFGSQIGLLRLSDLYPFWLEHELHNRHYDTNSNPYLPSEFEWQMDFSPIPNPVTLTNLSPQWVWVSDLSATNLSDWGVIENGQTFGMSASVQNVFGLDLEAAMALVNWPYPPQVASAGSSITLSNGVADMVYVRAEAPQLAGVGYYFAPVVTYEMEPAKQAAQQMPPVPLNRTTEYGYDQIPQAPPFSATNTTGLILGSVGHPMTVGGWAKLAIVNGYANKFAYLGQYFDKAYKANLDGSRSTNQTGVLSPYGEFFPIEPGKTFLTTLPDGVSTNVGECVVHALKLQLDVNHDGVMNTSWNGLDNTTQSKPFTFWANIDRDDSGSGSNLDRDIWMPQGATNNDYSFGQIRSLRNLEDLARLWICGMPTVPASQGYSVQIGWSQVESGTPKLRLYRASETNGGIGYLTNITTASQQILDYNYPVGEVTPASSITLPTSWFTNGLNRYFLFEAGGVGKGALTLTISQGANVIAQTSAWLDFHDIRDLYEEVAITSVIQTWPEMVQTNLNSDFKVVRHSTAGIGDAKQMAVFVHGWRMPYGDYEIFSQTMFKRLYWQGYQGKFAAVRWPTRSSDTDPDGLDYATYNRSEYISFQSGTGTALYLYDLRNRLLDYTISVCSHSQGGILMMEALAELAASSEAPIDNYVMMQTAVPAHCYDTAITNLPSLIDMETSIPTPNVYTNYAGGIRAALRGGNIYNLFNPVDFALASGWNQTGLGSWEHNQELLKPLVFFGYLYIATNQTAYVISNQFTGAFGITNLQNRIVTDPLELMPFVARPRSKAVGAQAGVGNVVNGPEYNLQSQLGFTTATYDHSGQFNRNIQTTQVRGFYFRLRQNLFPPAP